MQRSQPAPAGAVCGASRHIVAVTKFYRRGPSSLPEAMAASYSTWVPLLALASGPSFTRSEELTSKSRISLDPFRETCGCGVRQVSFNQRGVLHETGFADQL